MTTQQLKELIAAKESGKPIEYRVHNGTWVAHTADEWCFGMFEYRIKRDPKVVWLNEYPCAVSSVAYDSREAADIVAGPERIACRKFVEVIEEGK